MDDIFKKKLENKTAPYSDDLWSKIEKELDNETGKNRFFPLYIISGLVILFSLAGVGYFNYFQNTSSSPTSTHQIEVDNKRSSSEQNLISQHLNETNSPIIDVSTAPNSSLKRAEQSQINNSNVILEDTNEKDFEGTKSAYETEESKSGMISTVDESNSFGSNLLTTPDVLRMSQPDNKVAELGQDKPKGVRSNTKHSSVLVPALESIESLNPLNYAYVSEPSAPWMKHNIVDCSEGEIVRSGFSCDIYFSPEYAIRDLNSRNEGSLSYAVSRERTEHSALSFSSGIRVSYQNQSGLTFRSGINYSQINENFDYAEQIIEQIDTMIVINIETDPEGHVTTTIDTTTSIQYGTFNYSTRNSFKSVDIPLLVGLEMPINDRLSLSMNTGVFVNLSFMSSGRILSPELEPHWINNSNNDGQIYKSRLGLSYYGSIGLHHELSPGLELLVEPNLRYYSQSFTIGSYPLTQDYIKLGVLTGLRFRF